MPDKYVVANLPMAYPADGKHQGKLMLSDCEWRGLFLAE